ncbi:hypothetical protein BV394_04170 [Brevirhabdus pacifica]|uniref:Uncharacterized protein n=1 Tax=Brevirhabdus pacifica TaxID=1267768 RepID=A0A1U7DGB6_9RHOB|nr:cytochrome c [Brevirhabdus pacifica]APX89022.1 hypothetical protein BV394_04170 [Brevirhabdus pacifica]OWU80234.1 hypothetical protein ATO5_04850 [Loktanella sp. 22II-4b]PJJ86411.1 cytochrome c556 [Brevirhabdus pacifica]
MKTKNLWAAAAATLAIATAAGAHNGATGIVKERMEAMGAMGKVMKTLAPMMRGEAKYDAEQVREGARTLRQHSGDEGLTRLFPDGTTGKPSEASPAIWERPEDFARLADRLAAYADGLEKAADNPPAKGAGHGAGAMMGGASAGSMMGAAPAGNAGASGMMGGTSPMGGSGSAMMGGGAAMMGNTPVPALEELAAMPVNQVFTEVSKTCAACHGQYRLEAR